MIQPPATDFSPPPTLGPARLLSQPTGGQTEPGIVQASGVRSGCSGTSASFPTVPPTVHETLLTYLAQKSFRGVGGGRGRHVRTQGLFVAMSGRNVGLASLFLATVPASDASS